MAAPQNSTIPASQVRRRSTMSTPWGCLAGLFHHGDRAFGAAIQPVNLVGRWRRQMVLLGEHLQTFGADEPGLLEFERTAFVHQLALLGAQGFELVTGERIGKAREEGP